MESLDWSVLQHVHIISYNFTMWGPPVISWFINPMNTIVIGTINHSYWSYVHQLSYRLGAPTLHIADQLMLNGMGGSHPKNGPETPDARNTAEHPVLGGRNYGDWWFGTWILFSVIYGIILPIDELIFFQRGRAQPPSSMVSTGKNYGFNFNHIPIGSMVLLYMVTFTINIPPLC